MDLQVATEKDNQDLLRFFSEFPLRGLADFKISRGNDFFGPYKSQSEHFKTYFLKDQDQTLQSVASFIYKDVIKDGLVQKIACASDLRVRQNRKAVLAWSQHFLPVLEKETSENGLSSVFSAINLSDPTALNTFIRPRNMKRTMPRYYLYRKFQLISIHGRYPWTHKPLPSIKIRQGHSSNIDALLAYIIRRSQYRPFASVWDQASFEKKINRLPGFQLSHFQIAFDSDDNVIGCLAPWSPQNIQDFIPLSYGLRAHNFRQFLKFLWIFGLTRRLAKPVISTGEETKLQFQFLTHVFADNEDVFANLISAAYDNISPQEFLIYARVEQDFRLLPPQDWITASQPYALYAVTPPQMEMPEFLHPSLSVNPEIEAYGVF